MDIQIKWHQDQFNVHLASKEGAEPFLEVKGCRIANGSKGAFVSWPSTKNQQTGKYWSHCYGSEKFNAVVLSKAQETQPRATGRQQQRQQDEDDSSIPF